MKTLSTIIGYLMLAWLGITGVLYWTNIWGAIGFFGSLLTIPFSQIIAILILAFSSVENFIGYVLWFVVIGVLISYGSDQ